MALQPKREKAIEVDSIFTNELLNDLGNKDIKITYQIVLFLNLINYLFIEKLEGYYLIYGVWFLMELNIIVCLVGEQIKQTLIKTIRKYLENLDNAQENEIVDNILLIESRLKKIIKIQYYGFYILNIICYLYQFVYILDIIDHNQKHKQKAGIISLINRFYSFFWWIIYNTNGFS